MTKKDLNVFIVEVSASVYQNDVNFIVKAETKEEAEKFVENHVLNNRTAITIKDLYTTKLVDLEKGVIGEFDPHAGSEGD